MTALVLATKLFTLPKRPNTVARPRLFERLSQGIDGKLSLVTAPAGLGKTTLVVEWLAQQTDQAVAWITLDENDSEPVQFLRYLLAAMQNFHAELEKKRDGAESPKPAPENSLPEALTEREYEVLQLIAAGLSSSAIAEKLVVSKTRSGHTSRTCTASWAREAGLL